MMDIFKYRQFIDIISGDAEAIKKLSKRRSMEEFSSYSARLVCLLTFGLAVAEYFANL